MAQEHPFSLKLLVFIRHAWQLDPEADIPEFLPQPLPGNSKAPGSASLPEWGARWQNAWERIWTRYWIADTSRRQCPRQESMRQMHETMRQVMQPGRPLHPSIPPLRTADCNWDGIGRDAFNTGEQNLVQRIPTHMERQNLPSLIPAWKLGLGTVIRSFPCGRTAQ